MFVCTTKLLRNDGHNFPDNTHVRKNIRNFITTAYVILELNLNLKLEGIKNTCKFYENFGMLMTVVSIIFA